MKILKLALTIASALKIINYTKDTSEIIYTVNISDKEWDGNLMQVKWNRKQ